MPLQATRDEMSRNKPVSVVPLEPWGGVLLGALHEAPVIVGKLEMTTENRLSYSIFEEHWYSFLMAIVVASLKKNMPCLT